MPDNKLSVDDILSELELARGKSGKQPIAQMDMSRINSIVEDVLTRKHEEKIHNDNRELTELERVQLQKEIKEQTRRLTQELTNLEKPDESGAPRDRAAIHREAERIILSATELDWGTEETNSETVSELLNWEESESSFSEEKEEILLSVDEETEKKAPDAPESSEPPEEAEKRSGNAQRLHAELKDITGHFGNFKMEHASVEEGYMKTEITPKNYKEYKTNRNRKIDAFFLSKGRPQETENPEPPEKEKEAEASEIPQAPDAPENAEKPEAGPAAGDTAAEELDAEEKVQTQSFDSQNEFHSPSQAEQIGKNLRENLSSRKNSLIVLGAIGINAGVLSMVKSNGASMDLFGKLAMSPFLYAAIMLVLLAGAMAAAWPAWKKAAEGLRTGSYEKSYLYLATAVICLAVNVVFCFKPVMLMVPGIHLYSSVAILVLLVNAGAEYRDAKRILQNFRFVGGNGERYAVVPISDRKISRNMTKGAVDSEPMLVKNVKVSFFERFISRSFQRDVSDKIADRVLMIAFPASILLAGIGWYVSGSFFTAVSFLSGMMVMASGFLGAASIAFPLFDTSDVVSRFAGMIPGYDAVEEYNDTNAVLIEGRDLFPGDSVALRGVKTFQGKRVDDAIIDAASVVCASKSLLQNVFMTIINQKTDVLRPVDSIQYEDLMGLSAWVNERRVLIGNRELMINHSIAVPKKEYEDKFREDGYEMVYLAAEGELCALFLLEFSADPSVAGVMNLLKKNGIAAVLRTVDSCITADMLARVFEKDPEMFKILPARLHKEYEEETAPCERQETVLGNNGTLFGYIVSLSAAKKLHRCFLFGTRLYLISAVLGMVLLTAALLTGKLAAVGAWPVVLFMGGFFLLYWIYEKNMRV